MKFYNDIIFLWRNIFNHLCYTMKKAKKQVSQRTLQNLLNSYSFISQPNLRFTISTNSSAVPSSPSVLLSISTSFMLISTAEHFA